CVSPYYYGSSYDYW
nr:immunoglobulin heavy chain junction region [Mus musculus]